jgi:energy-coupling factor transporter transmembrane protein EcfT
MSPDKDSQSSARWISIVVTIVIGLLVLVAAGKALAFILKHFVPILALLVIAALVFIVWYRHTYSSGD